MNINKLVIKCKKMHSKNKLKEAWDIWCMIFETLKDNQNELMLVTSRFTDAEVYEICNYGKEQFEKRYFSNNHSLSETGEK